MQQYNNTTRHEASYNLVRTLTDQRVFIIQRAVDYVVSVVPSRPTPNQQTMQPVQKAETTFTPEVNTSSTQPAAQVVNSSPAAGLDESVALANVYAIWDDPERGQNNAPAA